MEWNEIGPWLFTSSPVVIGWGSHIFKFDPFILGHICWDMVPYVFGLAFIVRKLD